MKILIADDEDYTREGLMESIDWNEFGIDEVMQVTNGQEALKIAKWFHLDIVLTDIRMPKMDGIAFTTELLNAVPKAWGGSGLPPRLQKLPHSGHRSQLRVLSAEAADLPGEREHPAQWIPAFRWRTIRWGAFWRSARSKRRNRMPKSRPTTAT